MPTGEVGGGWEPGARIRAIRSQLRTKAGRKRSNSGGKRAAYNLGGPPQLNFAAVFLTRRIRRASVPALGRDLRDQIAPKTALSAVFGANIGSCAPRGGRKSVGNGVISGRQRAVRRPRAPVGVI